MKLAIFFALLLVTTASAFVPPSSTKTITTTTVLLSTIEEDDVHAVSALDSRRTFLLSSATIAGAVCGTLVASPPTLSTIANAAVTSPLVDADYTAVAKDIAAIIKKDSNKGPTLVRLAWHASGTYDKMSKTGGSGGVGNGGGTMYFKEELKHGGNAGLQVTAVKWLEPLKKKYGKSISYADLYTLAGVVAIKELGGPKIKWNAGRFDALDPSSVTPDGRLPNAETGPKGADPSDSAHLRTIFNRMGFNDQEIVALSGAHAIGRCHTTASGFDGPWSPTPTTFNNVYFTLLETVDWKQRDWSGPFQYEDGSKKLMMLPTDLALIKDTKFKRYVDVYSKDQAKFFVDFAKAFNKLEELGTANLKAVEWA